MDEGREGAGPGVPKSSEPLDEERPPSLAGILRFVLDVRDVPFGKRGSAGALWDER